MLLITYFDFGPHIFCYEAVQSSPFEVEDFPWVLDFGWVENLASGSQTSDGGNIKDSWGDHTAGELEGVGGRFPKMNCC